MRSKITQKIGQGCYGRVYKVNDGENQYIVKRNIIDKNQESFSSIKEMDLMYNLNHPNIVRLLDVSFGSPISRLSPAGRGNKNDKLYFIMECGNCDMYRLIDERLIPDHALIYLFAQMLLGLEYLHCRNIVHRDIKPGNIIYFEYSNDNQNQSQLTDFSVKFCDFGMSKWNDDKVPGTPGVTTYVYRAPEVVMAKEYDCKSDIWSLGIVFTEIITGQPIIGCMDEMIQILCNQIYKSSDNDVDTYLRCIQDLNLDDLESDIINEIIIDKQLPEELKKLYATYPILPRMLKFDPTTRATASELLLDPYFDEIRWYIDMIHAEYPAEYKNTAPEIRQLSDRRRQMIELVKIILGRDGLPIWLNYRTISMAIDLYDSYLEQPDIQGIDLRILALSCIHLAAKYHCTMNIPPKFMDIVPSDLVTKKDLAKYNDGLQLDIIQYHYKKYGKLFRNNFYELLPYPVDYPEYIMKYLNLTGEINVNEFVENEINSIKTE